MAHGAERSLRKSRTSVQTWGRVAARGGAGRRTHVPGVADRKRSGAGRRPRCCLLALSARASPLPLSRRGRCLRQEALLAALEPSPAPPTAPESITRHGFRWVPNAVSCAFWRIFVLRFIFHGGFYHSSPPAPGPPLHLLPSAAATPFPGAWPCLGLDHHVLRVPVPGGAGGHTAQTLTVRSHGSPRRCHRLLPASSEGWGLGLSLGSLRS